MQIVRTANDVLDAEFLSIRAKILEVAAALDRLNRADGDLTNDPRTVGIRRAIDVLLSEGNQKAEEVQLVFSRHYEPEWRRQFGLTAHQNGKK